MVTGKSDERQVFLEMTAEADPALAELWDNEEDAAYDGLECGKAQDSYPPLEKGD